MPFFTANISYFPLKALKLLHRCVLFSCSEREWPYNEEKKWAGEETVRKSVWKCWKARAITLHLAWILSKHGPHWPGSPTQIIHESTTPPITHTLQKHTHTLFSIQYTGVTLELDMETLTKPNSCKNTQKNTPTRWQNDLLDSFVTLSEEP